MTSSAPTQNLAPRRFDAWAALCVAIYVALGLALITRVPLELAPDERAHFEYVQHIAATHSLPVFAGTPPPKYGYEFHQPPLYYALAAPFWAAAGEGGQRYAARLVSLLCGALTVWLVLAAGRAMFGSSARGEILARRAAILAALWPMHIAVGASANNDALGGLCCAALFWRLALLSRRAPVVRDGVWIGALCGLGLLSKSTTLTVSVAAILALWHLSRRAHALDEDSIGDAPQELAAEPGKVLGAGVAASLVGCGWMLVRNTMLYGDALAFGAFQAASNAATGLSMSVALQAGLPILYARNVLFVLLATSWGFYGGPNSALRAVNPFGESPQWPGGWLLLAALVLAAASTWVLVRAVALSVRVLSRLRAGQGSGRDVVWLWWGVASMLAGLAYVQFSLTNFSGAQGRYLIPAVLPACVLASRAWDDLPRSVRTPLSWAVALLLAALTLANAVAWRTLN